MTRLFKNKKSTDRLIANQQGIALVLAVLILSNLLMITFIVTDVILRIGKTSRAIGESEAAYYAAESAIEEAVYKIEKEQNGTTLGTEESLSGGFLNNTRATWTRFVKPINTVSGVICVDENNAVAVYNDPAHSAEYYAENAGYGGGDNCVYTDDFNTVITKNDPLKVRLQPGESFDIDFSILMPPALGFYPSSIEIEWNRSTEGSIIIYNSSGQEVDNFRNYPPKKRSIDFSSDPDTPKPHIRFINEDEGDNVIVYTLSPGSNAEGTFMPIGIEVTAKGYFDNFKERIIVVTRKNWKIY